MNRLKECRERMNYSQKYVALSIGVSAPVVSQWEGGKRRISRDNLIKLSELFGVSMDYLLNREPESEDAEGEEDRLVFIYRQLNHDGRQLLLDSAESYFARAALRQDGSAEMAK